MKENGNNKTRKRFTSLFALMLVFSFVLAFSTSASAQCDAGAISKLIKQLREECNKEGEPNAIQCTKTGEKLSKVVKTLNSLTSNGSLTIGPRYIQFNKDQDGTVIAPGDRTFVSGAPLEKDGASLTLTHHDGNAALDVVVCKIDAAGKATRLDSFTLDGKKMKNGETVTKNYTGLKGNFFQVFLNGKGIGTKFKLTFKAVQK